VQRNGEDDSSLLVSEVDGVSRFVASLGQKVKSVKEEVSKLHGSAMDEFKSKVAAACQELHGRLDEISNQAMA
jgi:transcription antitermination factor NusG